MQQSRIAGAVHRAMSRTRAVAAALARVRGLALTLPLVGVFSFLAITFANAAPAPADRELFVRYGCYQCHGYEGQGGDGLRIAPSPYPFEAFAAKVRKPANEMPAYAPEVLSDADLQALYRYVAAIPEPSADLPVR